MKVRQWRTLVVLLGAVSVFGCNAGMQPEGPNAEQVKAKEAALPPEQQISMLEHAPMPAAEKAKKVAEIKAKYGIK